MKHLARYGIIHIFAFFLILVSVNAAPHKFYVSISQIDVNSENSSLEITSRIFTHDLTAAVEKEHNTRLLLGTEREDPGAKEKIGKYLQDHFHLIQSGNELDYIFLGFEIENDIIWLYIEAAYIDELKELSVENSLIMELFEDQKNIVNLRFDGKTRSYICTKSEPSRTFTIN